MQPIFGLPDGLIAALSKTEKYADIMFQTTDIYPVMPDRS